MATDVISPFEKDVDEHGGYQYATNNRRSSIYVYQHFYDVIMRAAQLDGKRVVDVGCGDGTYTARLRRETKAVSLTGLDPAVKAIERAQRMYEQKPHELSFECGFVHDLVARGLHYDLAIYGGVLHHVADPAAEIADGFRLADEIFILEPNGWNPVLKYNERYSPYHLEHEERSYRRGQIHHWIEQAGAEIVKSFYFGLVPVFCPDWMVAICSRVEPLVERIPLLRMFACGQVGILARRKTQTSYQKIAA
ncbi:MAG TPA: class I SAM-dependent methyltransferase [Pirellulales bacterium]|jgi:SAM-dependent methyltransferase|nr:class I SAM-dependent methyltransferase [Pirellulales bacterium]